MRLQAGLQIDAVSLAGWMQVGFQSAGVSLDVGRISIRRGIAGCRSDFNPTGYRVGLKPDLQPDLQGYLAGWM
jgi:hypothetical protein